MGETSVKHRQPNMKLEKTDKKKQTTTVTFGIHEIAYLIKGIQDRIHKYEIMNPRPEDDEISYQFNLILLEKLEYVRNAALPE